MLTLSGVSAHYGAVQALHEVSLEVKEGEIVTLIGANGAGKSTLLMSICGMPTPTAGRIEFDGQALCGLATPTIMRRGLAIAPEGRRIFPSLCILDNLKMGAFFSSATQCRADLERIFDWFPRLQERAAQRAGTLSGGEQQMLAIGRALMSRPRLLLLDEPTLGLAPQIMQQIFAIIRRIRAAGVTVLLVEQNANQALALADRAYVLETGRIVLQGTGNELLHEPAVRQAYLGV